jgi:hypothetical protein
LFHKVLLTVSVAVEDMIAKDQLGTFVDLKWFIEMRIKWGLRFKAHFTYQNHAGRYVVSRVEQRFQMVTSIARSSHIIVKEPKVVFETLFARLQSVLVQIGVHLFDNELDVLGLLRVTWTQKEE